MPHVSDNRQPRRRMMVETRTTARDWQWLEDMMAEDALAAQPMQMIRRIPKNYARRTGGQTTQAVEEAGTSSQAYLPSTPQIQGTTIPSSMSSPSQQAFLDELSSPGFQHFISDMLHEGDGGYRPDTQFDLGWQWVSEGVGSSRPERARVRSIACLYGSWWDSSISSTRSGWILGRIVYGVCPSADSSGVTYTNSAARRASSTGAGPQSSTSSRVQHRRPYGRRNWEGNKHRVHALTAVARLKPWMLRSSGGVASCPCASRSRESSFVPFVPNA
ncbi:hypothetical protein PIB30_034152 [Stylosanthes scabra]|uniref:Uncharacterized protein n=1 Tax=Stylosanthes scabra TaxID=79078 RepID=A0ABU6WDQ3_9FABA|nr:hypothetical protein [Stylosanthes scabra]